MLSLFSCTFWPSVCLLLINVFLDFLPLFYMYYLFFLILSCVCQSLNHVWLFMTLWTVAYQAPLSMVFPRQEYWSGFLFPSPRDFSDPGIEPRFPALQVDSLPLSHLGNRWTIWAIFIFRRLISCQLHNLQIFSPILQE